ncbi:MAG: PAS domain S-box protein [Desulfobacteraceae bacterium]|nr:PAS domain S-box protein [Desulfobacteraceae bacterium]
MNWVLKHTGKKPAKKTILILGAVSMAVFMLIMVLGVRARHAMTEKITDRANTTLLLSFQVTEDFYVRYTILFKALSGMDRVRAHEHESVAAMLTRMNSQFPELVNIAAVDRSGKFFASGRAFDPERTPSISHLDFFKKVSRGDEGAVMNPHVGPISKVRVTGVVVPIVDNQGRFNGLIGSSIRFSALTELWEKTLASTTGLDFAAVDARGIIQFTSRTLKAFMGKSADSVSFLAPADSGMMREIDGQSYYIARKYSPASTLTLYVIARLKVSPVDFIRENTMLMFLNLLLLTVLLLFMEHTRKSAELMAGISASERKFRRLMDSLPSILIRVDHNGKILHWNSVAEKASHLTEQAARGMSVDRVFEQLKGRMDLIQGALENITPRNSFKVKREINNHTVYEDIFIHPQMEAKERSAVIRIEDVTERVKMEEIMVKTEKIMTIGGMAAGMAHEINNPLSAVLQNAQSLENRMMKDSTANNRAAEAAGTDFALIRQYMTGRRFPDMIRSIQKSAERAAGIVYNMLDFSYHNRRGLTGCDLNNLVETSIELAGREYDLKKRYTFSDIRILRSFSKDLPPVICNSTEIEQVIINLLKNAAQAFYEAETSNAALRLATRQEGDFAVIEVRDNGPGMKEEVRKRIFDPFFTTKAPGIGTGLGLSVSYYIITQKHGGKITVDSSPGKGTCFTIKIPFDPVTIEDGNNDP